MKDAINENSAPVEREELNGEAAAPCHGRREFLVNASIGAGSLVLGLSSLRSAQAQATAQEKAPAQTPAQTAGAAASPSDEVVLKMEDASPLSNVGGAKTIETKAGKIIVARTGETSFAACSAICPHRGGPIEYDAQAKEFFCPWHRSRFALDGKVLRPPARESLRSYATQSAAVVSLKADKTDKKVAG